MGILDSLWPFQRKFSEIPGAREAAIAGLLGGVGIGASSIIILNHAKYAYRTSIYSGFAIFWVTFIFYGLEQRRMKRLSEQFMDSYKSGKLD